MRASTSEKLRPAASTLIRISPGRGRGSGASRISRTSGPPTLVIQIARMTTPVIASRASKLSETRRPGLSLEIPSPRHRLAHLDRLERQAKRGARIVEPRGLSEAVALALLRDRSRRPADLVGADAGVDRFALFRQEA